MDCDSVGLCMPLPDLAGLLEDDKEILCTSSSDILAVDKGLSGVESDMEEFSLDFDLETTDMNSDSKSLIFDTEFLQEVTEEK